MQRAGDNLPPVTSIPLDSSSTVSAMKTSLASKIPLPDIAHVRLVHAGRVLEEDVLLSSLISSTTEGISILVVLPRRTSDVKVSPSSPETCKQPSPSCAVEEETVTG
mmetsp:Transcript_18815/g.61788  ORF Transcript_18815/g.61788 Transcript_18815/m.61788 type:complete len:107 (-) Transcript_18815:60-380(-)